MFPLLAAVALTSVAPALAQSSSPADTLFAEGRDLLEQGRYVEACAKLAKSEELAPAVGTLLNLGYCWEQAGKLGSASDAYAKAEVLARSLGEPKRAQFAKERYAAVETRATKLIVRVTKPEAPGLVVRRNGVAMTKADLERPMAIDPEDHVVTASAPGYATWKGAILVKGEASVVTVIIPPLSESTRMLSSIGVRRAAALGLGVASACAIGAGIGVALSAKSHYDDASRHCDSGGCDDVGRDLQRSAVTQGNVATALVGFGLLSGAAGAYLWVIGAPPPDEGTPAPVRKASLRVETRALGVGIGGEF